MYTGHAQDPPGTLGLEAVLSTAKMSFGSDEDIFLTQNKFRQSSPSISSDEDLLGIKLTPVPRPLKLHVKTYADGFSDISDEVVVDKSKKS